MNKNFILKNRTLFLPVVIITVLLFLAIFADFIAPYGVSESDYSMTLSSPSLKHLFGTDELGRDVLSRIIFSLRISFLMGIIPTALLIILGTLLGIYSGISGKWIDSIIMRLCDIGLAFPFMIMAMAIVYNFGSGIMPMILTMTILGWSSIARIIRSQTKSIIKEQYIEAAISMGASKANIILKHIIPNLKGTIIVLFTINIPKGILAEASLSFLGFGAQPPMTSLGIMVSKGRNFLFDAPWISITPGFVILIMALCFNSFGDGLKKHFEDFKRGNYDE